MIRIGDKKRFEYLLNRGVYPSFTDTNGNSALHYCIRLENIDFLSYLLEGEYLTFNNINDENCITDLTKLHTTFVNLNSSRRLMNNHTTLSSILP